MGLNVDMSGVKAGGFDAKPNGWYHVAITDAELRESGENAKNPGSNYISWEFTIQDGPHENGKFWTNASLLPQALFTLKNMQKAIGDDRDNLPIEDDEETGEEGIITTWIGEHLLVRNSQREYEGEKRDNLKAFKEYDEDSWTPMGEDDDSSSSGGLMP